VPRATNKPSPWRVAPVTPESWGDFQRLFAARGSPHYCWCTLHRFRDAHELTSDGKRRRMHALVAGGTPIGVLAYDGDEPVGWCSVAPRESYVKLARSRTMPRVSEEPTWTVLCFFVTRPYRGKGLPRALLAGAVKYARAAGATEVEGYPYDTAGITSTHRGHSSIFRAAGFRRQDKRWVWRASGSR
jgi:GNAT superfamily N-acetyltransferase